MAVKIRFDLPEDATYHDALAMPTKAIPRNGPQEMQGGIFDRDGNFIQSSGLFRGVKSPIMAYGRVEADGADLFEGKAGYGGFLYRGHYGHFLIESMSRMWRLMRDKEFDRIFFHAHPGHVAPCKIGEFIFSRMGISLDRISVITKPIKFSSITIPGTSLRLGGEECHMVHRQVCAAVADGVEADYFSSPPSDARPIYFSRTKFRVRPVFGERELEEELRKNDWEIVYPETLTVEQQIKISRKSNVYCGVIGSAMHNLVFSRSGTKVFYVEREPSQKTTYNTLESLDKVIGLDAKYIPANVKSETVAGPFLIDPNVVLNSLHCAGLVSKPRWFDLEKIAAEYEQHIALSKAQKA